MCIADASLLDRQNVLSTLGKMQKKKNDTENKLKYFSPSQTPDERLQLVLRRAVPPYWVDPATLEAITGELHGLALQPCARGVGGRCRDLATLL